MCATTRPDLNWPGNALVFLFQMERGVIFVSLKDNVQFS